MLRSQHKAFGYDHFKEYDDAHYISAKILQPWKDNNQWDRTE